MEEMNQEDRPLWDLLGKAERAKAPAGFADSIMAKISAVEQPAVPVPHGTWGRWKWSGAVAAALVVCVSLVISLQDSSVSQDTYAVQVVDDELLLDVAYASLGSESLQDAVCLLSSQESVADMSDSEIVGLVF